MITSDAAITIKKRIRWALENLGKACLLVVCALTWLRLAHGAVDGLPTLAVSVFAVLASVTSLLYNRARAYGPGRLQRRCLLAAERCLRALLLFTIGVLVVALVYWWVPASLHVPMNSGRLPHWFLLAVSMPICMLFGFSGLSFVTALRDLIPPMISSQRLRRRIRADYPFHK
ncbi:hypothetical protein [Pseudorhodoferax sp. Leaf267]|uniref:hypothetical protein n=1 Tax=Pseudorhodoferax sp. Leaf267 TaxID=1736316 RepID=UPI0012E10FF0|nr:hypothetical protein [Pseudorhodoferax sp. Leaf267]